MTDSSSNVDRSGVPAPDANHCGAAISRRAVLRGGTLFLATAASGCFSRLAIGDAADAKAPKPILRVGLVTDLHYAEKPAAGARNYRQAIARAEKAVEQFNADSVDVIVEVGDLVDSADTVEHELGYVKRMKQVFDAAKAPRHFVLGNHCVEGLTKEQFLSGVAQAKSYYSFDAKDHHFVILDACFRADGKDYGAKNAQWDDANLAAAELEWLAADLKANKLPTLVFVHQRLDNGTKFAAKNAAAARKILEAAGNVCAVFHGHEHKNDHSLIAGIHYTTLAALVESAPAKKAAAKSAGKAAEKTVPSGGDAIGDAIGDAKDGAKRADVVSNFSVLDVLADGNLAVRGFAQQAAYHWTKTK